MAEGPSPECFVVDMVGGPVPGSRYLYDGVTTYDGVNKVSWPLPHVMLGPPDSPPGVYVKAGESSLSQGNDHVVRGAVYEWRKCPECLDQGKYWTEWSDSAESSPELKALVVCYPDDPDGTVLIRCSTCREGDKS